MTEVAGEAVVFTAASFLCGAGRLGSAEDPPERAKMSI